MSTVINVTNRAYEDTSFAWGRFSKGRTIRNYGTESTTHMSEISEIQLANLLSDELENVVGSMKSSVELCGNWQSNE